MKKPNLKLRKPGSALHTRSFRVGGYSVISSLIVVGIAVAANVLVCALPSSMTQFDISSQQLFTISEQTESIVGGLTDEVTVYWIVQSGQEDTTIDTLLSRYEGLSKEINVVKKDPDVYPTFVQQYTDESTYNNSLVVECGDRSRYISYYDIYEYDTSNYYYTGSYDVSFAGEGALTSAISYVTNEDLPTVYTLTGHGESELSTSFSDAVEKQNVTLSELSLLTVEEVPEDADLILIYAPQSDLSEEECDTLSAWLKEGGRLLLITDPEETAGSRTNLEELMAGYGVTAAEGIVLEQDQNHYISGAPYYLLPSYGSHDITSPLSEGGYYVLLPIAQGLLVSDSLPDNVSVSKLLTTSSDAFSKIAGYSLSTYEKEDGDIDGPFSLAVAITETLDSGDESRLVWISSAAIVDDSTDSRVSGGNSDFFLNCISWMCGEEESITIHSKSLSTTYLTISDGTAALLTAIVVGVLPAGYLAAGIVIRVRRKRR